MDKLSQIKNPITLELEQFNELITSSLKSSNPLLSSVLSHISQRNGKMMRPILVLLTAKSLGSVSSSTLHGAVALELLHTASLVHDDVVDESTKRRGQLSVNAIYNNKVSVLVGDYLLATCLIEANRSDNNRVVDAISQLGRDLSDGELLQLSNISNQEIREDIYFDVIRKKTAALFSACTRVAAFSINASPAVIEKVSLLGEYIGVCFQIKDDIFDYFDVQDLGKPTGNDMLEGKLTLPVIHALNKVQDAEAYRLAAAVKSGVATQEDIARLVAFTKENSGIDYAVKVMNKYRDDAMNLVLQLPPSASQLALISYLDYLVDRVK